MPCITSQVVLAAVERLAVVALEHAADPIPQVRRVVWFSGGGGFGLGDRNGSDWSHRCVAGRCVGRLAFDFDFATRFVQRFGNGRSPPKLNRSRRSPRWPLLRDGTRRHSVGSGFLLHRFNRDLIVESSARL